MLCWRLWRGLPAVVAWDLLPALWVVRPDLLVSIKATVTLESAGRLSANPGGPHGLVKGASDVAAARALILASLAGAFESRLADRA